MPTKNKILKNVKLIKALLVETQKLIDKAEEEKERNKKFSLRENKKDGYVYI